MTLKPTKPQPAPKLITTFDGDYIPETFIDFERKPVLWLPNGKALVRPIGFCSSKPD